MTTIISGTTGVDNVAPNSVDNTDLKSSVPFRYSYVSAEQVITSAGLLTLAHGLGEQPKLMQGFLVCKVAEFGYAVGDVVSALLTVSSSSVADHFGAQSKADAANIYVRYGTNPFIVGNWATGATTQITPANWRLVVRAWA